MEFISLKEGELLIRVDSIKKVWKDIDDCRDKPTFRSRDRDGPTYTYRIILDGEDESIYISEKDYYNVISAIKNEKNEKNDRSKN